MEIYKSKYQTMSYDAGSKTLHNSFFPETKNWTIATYKEEFYALVQEMKKYDAAKILVDMRNFHYTVYPELQEWHNQNVFMPFVDRIKKTAIVISSDIFAQVSVQQTMDESVGINFETRYFDKMEEALKWLDS